MAKRTRALYSSESEAILIRAHFSYQFRSDEIEENAQALISTLLSQSAASFVASTAVNDPRGGQIVSSDRSPPFLDHDRLPSNDLWSAAFREAVKRTMKDSEISRMEGLNVAQLFEQLEITDERATRDDAFLRGVKFLRSIQVPLENFKLALDLASPLTSLEPTTLTVCGVIRSVTAVSTNIRRMVRGLLVSSSC